MLFAGLRKTYSWKATYLHQDLNFLSNYLLQTSQANKYPHRSNVQGDVSRIHDLIPKSCPIAYQWIV